ncbi:TPA: hypothetical protein JG874_001687 [Enterobacter hormaechei subsp. steigerwaltii]|nr:hypothetical protein [Enterobacter hormaechei subsp. steigerwaltii]
MSTITKEWLQQKIADMEAARDEIPFGLDEDDSKTLAALRIALASLEAEDAAKCPHQWSFGGLNKLQSQKQCVKCGRVELATQPAPVSVPDERAAFNSWNNDIDCPLAGCDAKTAAWRAWGRRAAMLQGAEPVTTAISCTK